MIKIQAFFNKQLKDFDNAAFIRLLKIFSCMAMVVIVYAAVFSGFQIVDEFEHLHASWLVSIGKLPYRDFFEHHNPLLWYLSAPLLRLFYDNVIIFYVMRLLSLAASVLTGWYIYKISLFWGDKRSAWLAIALYLGNYMSVLNFYQFRPDIYMNLCFILGLYYWFLYLQHNRLIYLAYSFLGFTFSFLFLQKISFLLISVEIILLVLIWLKKMIFKDIALAAIPSLIVIFLFLGFLYAKDILPNYIEMNYHLNGAMLFYYDRGVFWYNNFVLSLYGLAVLVGIYFYKKENIYFRICTVIYLTEFLLRGFYFAPHTHYYSLVTDLVAIILSVMAPKIMPKHKIFAMILLITMFLHLGHLYNKLENTLENHNSYKHYQLTDWAHKNSNPDDMLMNGYDMIFNIYRPDVSYFWFQLDTLVPIMQREYDFQEIDVNKIILQMRPKFVYAVDYVNLMAYRTYGETNFSQRFIPELMHIFYKPTPFENLYELK